MMAYNHWLLKTNIYLVDHVITVSRNGILERSNFYRYVKAKFSCNLSRNQCFVASCDYLLSMLPPAHGTNFSVVSFAVFI